MFNQLVKQPLIPLAILTMGADEQHPHPSRDADPRPDAESASPAQTDTADAADADRTWIDELAAALRELATQGSGQDDDTMRRETPDEPKT